MDANRVEGSSEAADVAGELREHTKFLQWDREINGKLYYALWILFMGGFALSLSNTNQPSFYSNSLARFLLHSLRLLAVVGTALNFILQSRAIDAVRGARVISTQMAFFAALKSEERPGDAARALHEAVKRDEKLRKSDAWNSRLEIGLIIIAALFLACGLVITWNVFPTAQPK